MREVFLPFMFCDIPPRWKVRGSMSWRAQSLARSWMRVFSRAADIMCDTSGSQLKSVPMKYGVLGNCIIRVVAAAARKEGRKEGRSHLKGP